MKWIISLIKIQERGLNLQYGTFEIDCGLQLKSLRVETHCVTTLSSDSPEIQN